MLYKIALLIVIFFIALGVWITPKIIQAQKVDTPCTQLVGPLYYCGEAEIMQKFLEKFKSNPNFSF